MTSIYERLRDFPLLKGLDNNQISDLAERTKLDFRRVDNGEIIFKEGDKVDNLNFIFTGKIEMHLMIPDSEVKLEITVGQGAVTGAGNMFGLYNFYPCTGISKDNLSFLRISKEEYLNLLNLNNIYLLNFINYLSASSQRFEYDFQTFLKGDLSAKMIFLYLNYNGKNAEEFIVNADNCQLSALVGEDETKIELWKKSASESGFIEIIDDKRFKIIMQKGKQVKNR